MRHVQIICLAIVLFPFAIVCLFGDPRNDRLNKRLAKRRLASQRLRDCSAISG